MAPITQTLVWRREVKGLGGGIGAGPRHRNQVGLCGMVVTWAGASFFPFKFRWGEEESWNGLSYKQVLAMRRDEAYRPGRRLYAFVIN